MCSMSITTPSPSPSTTTLSSTLPPLALFLSGPPGAGKSTLGKEFSKLAKFAMIDLDTATDPLVEVIMGLVETKDLHDPKLAALTRNPRYATVLNLAVENISNGVSCVLVAPFTSERKARGSWEKSQKAIEAAGGRAVLAWVHVDPKTLEARMRERNSERDSIKLKDLNGYLATVDFNAPVVDHIVVEASLTTSEQAAQLFRDLRLY